MLIWHTMPDTQSDPLIGSRIREYEILDVIGKGGMGAVYRARHVYLEEQRAIKVIHTRLAQDKGFVNRFIREARILVKLSHPNLVRLHEFGTLEESIFFMVLELLQGETVLDRIRRLKKIPVEDSIRIVREAALGLHSAHLKRIVHRDISPDNLLIVKDDTGKEITKVVDFGIAKPNFEPGLTAVNLFVGKLEYCSPEQCGAAGDESVDARSDVYSLGATFYHMLTGKLPFYGESVKDYVVKHAQENPPPLSNYLPAGNLTAALYRVILRSMAKRKEERLASMEAFIADLDKLGLPVRTVVIADRPTEAFTEKFDVAPTVGSLFAKRYLIEGQLGKGGMGTVYKATDKILDVPVALKIMNAMQSEKTLERFKREVILARKVAHPNVCRTIDIGESNGTHYVSMDYIEGVTLADMLKKEGKLPIETGINITRQVLKALEEAHRQNIVHRDLKPQNVMIDATQRALIMDFGISLSAGAERLTQVGSLLGTAQYMAPEQIEGKDIDLRVDLYAMGIILFQMLTATLPFSGESTMAILYAHVKQPPLKPSAVIPDFPPELERIILKALEKDPAQRFSSATEFLQALDAFTGTAAAIASPQELAVHRLLAEKDYAKAIKYLKSLLEDEPSNEEWNHLLKLATAEKLQRDLRLAFHLIRKMEFPRAEKLIARLQQESAGPGVEKQIRSLQSKIQSRKRQQVSEIIQQSEKLLEEKQWEEVQQKIKTASEILPDDPRIPKLLEKLLVLQHHQLPERIRLQMNDAEQDLLRAQNDLDESSALQTLNEAEQKIRLLRKELPSFDSFQQLEQRMIALRHSRSEERTLEQNLGSAFERLAVADVSRAGEMIRNIHSDTRDPFLRQLLERLSHSIDGLASSMSARDYSKARDQIAALQAEDERAWLVPYSHLFSQLRETIEREQVRETDFRVLFQEGKEKYDAWNWADAIQSWKKALELFPDDTTVRQWLQVAEDRVKEDLNVRTHVLSELNRCSLLLSKNKWDEVRSILKDSESRANEYRLEDLNTMIQSIRHQLDESIALEKEKARRKAQEEAETKAATARTEAARAEAAKAEAEAAARAAQAKKLSEAVVPQQIPSAQPRSRSTLWIGVGVAAVLAIAVLFWVFMPSESKTINQAQQLAQQGKLQDAVSVLQQYTQAHPNSERALQLQNEFQTQIRAQEQRTQAENALSEARKLRDAKDWPGAIRQYERALQFDPGNRAIAQELEDIKAKQSASGTAEKIASSLANARDLLQKQQYDNASKVTEEILTADPKNTDARDLLNRIKSQKAEEIDRRLSDAKSLLENKKLTDAEKVASSVFTLDPGNREASKILNEIRTAASLQGTGALSVNCEPYCRVYIDGKDLGDSPYPKKPISAGPHSVRVQKSGYKEVSQNVVIHNGEEKNLFFKLEKQ
ncbi:MAG: hypothetical protein C5B54_06095 [Acidobacteria bacterium]|nr:MAG: hypothetical protein C5B54_06095 [Acidobacteriota bacterium]